MENFLDELVKNVQASGRYQFISEDLIRQVGQSELNKGRKLKEAIKLTRSKLHQVAVAYQETPIPYNQLNETLASLPSDLHAPEMLNFCRETMRRHVSTAERLPILENYYNEIFSALPPIHSVMDLACGLNPLARPWMPLPDDAVYYACDIYEDMTDFINRFIVYTGQNGSASMCNLTRSIPSTSVDLTFLLKSVPCLEQLDKNLIPQLLQQIQSRFIVVSFPGRSIGGKNKGMTDFYSKHFEEILNNLPFESHLYSFHTELTYLLVRINK
ncbi:MAG: hypothetical protein LWX83_16420 [Anaerolineae bacterium]|nr:hypothetical protein [Anaerolineae bacterium]